MISLVAIVCSRGSHRRQHESNCHRSMMRFFTCHNKGLFSLVRSQYSAGINYIKQHTDSMHQVYGEDAASRIDSITRFQGGSTNTFCI